jgi:hypothetical protein
MKKAILPFLLLFQTFLWGNDVQIAYFARIELPDTIWDYGNTTSDECKLYWRIGQSPFGGCIDGCKGILDTNVIIYFEDSDVTDVGMTNIWQLSTATHSAFDVMRDEFKHWQKCGNLTLSAAATDSMVEHIITLMEGVKSSSVAYEQNCSLSDYDKTKECAYDYWIWSPVAYYPPLVEDALAGITASRPPLGRNAVIRRQGRTLLFPAELQGKRFMMFDLTGKVIRQGILTKTLLKGTAQPLVIKIQGLEPELLP